MRATTSTSLLSIPLLSSQRTFSVYTHNEQGKVLRVDISTRTKTVSDAIEAALA